MKALTIGTRIQFIALDGGLKNGVIIDDNKLILKPSNQYRVRTDSGTIWRTTGENIISIQANPTEDGKPKQAVNDTVPQNQAELF